jgi:hypothetical protein
VAVLRRSSAPINPLWSGSGFPLSPGDLGKAPVEESLRATPGMLGKLTREGKVGAEGMRQVLSAGVSRQQVKDALAQHTGRLADAFGFEVLSPKGFEAGAKYLLKPGYR